ncbi:hypothetical protein AK825_11575 [Psychrobacter sp. P11G5]|nr:hypothetical protein AK825_11575 [Psychrobacter sp. P11G5]
MIDPAYDELFFIINLLMTCLINTNFLAKTMLKPFKYLLLTDYKYKKASVATLAFYETDIIFNNLLKLYDLKTVVKSIQYINISAT